MKFVCKDIKNPSTGNEIFYVFLQRIVKQNRPLSVSHNPTNTYIKYLQEKRKGSLNQDLDLTIYDINTLLGRHTMQQCRR